MRVARSLLNCVAFVASAMSAFGQSIESDLNPTLGPAVLLSTDVNSSTDPQVSQSEAELGPIILIASIAELDENDDSPPSPKSLNDEGHFPFVNEAKYSPQIGMLPIPVFIPLIPQLTGEPLPLRMSSIPVHPNQIQFHLSEAVRHLASIGLAGEAERIQELQQQIHHDHAQRLLIAFKEAQLRELQSEIAHLKRDQPMVEVEKQLSRNAMSGNPSYESQDDELPSEIVRPRQVQQTSATETRAVTIRMKYLEMDADATASLLTKLFGRQERPGENAAHEMVGALPLNPQMSELVDAYSKRAEAKVAWTPSLIIPVGGSGQVFQEVSTENGYETAVALSTKTRVSANGNLRLLLIGEITTDRQTTNPDAIGRMTKNRMETEVEPGQTVAIIFPQRSRADENGVEELKSVLMLVTAEVSQAAMNPPK